MLGSLTFDIIVIPGSGSLDGCRIVHSTLSVSLAVLTTRAYQLKSILQVTSARR